MLLVELAGSDQNFDAREYNVISNGLRRIFGTTKDEVAALINQATLNLAHLRGTGRFATLLKDNMTLEERQVVMEVIEEVIAADGVEDGFETYLRHKFSDLLGVPLQYTDAQIEEIMSARHFVDVRQTPGGPAPAETSRALGRSREILAADESWLGATGDRLAAAQARLRQRAEAL